MFGYIFSVLSLDIFVYGRHKDYLSDNELWIIIKLIYHHLPKIVIKKYLRFAYFSQLLNLFSSEQLNMSIFPKKLPIFFPKMSLEN